jgi:hypothetical protein
VENRSSRPAGPAEAAEVVLSADGWGPVGKPVHDGDGAVVLSRCPTAEHGPVLFQVLPSAPAGRWRLTVEHSVEGCAIATVEVVENPAEDFQAPNTLLAFERLTGGRLELAFDLRRFQQRIVVMLVGDVPASCSCAATRIRSVRIAPAVIERTP